MQPIKFNANKGTQTIPEIHNEASDVDLQPFSLKKEKGTNNTVKQHVPEFYKQLTKNKSLHGNNVVVKPHKSKFYKQLEEKRNMSS